MERRLPKETTDVVREQLDEFMALLDERGYTPNAKTTYEQNIDRFIRWLEGGFDPEGPR